MIKKNSTYMWIIIYCTYLYIVYIYNTNSYAYVGGHVLFFLIVRNCSFFMGIIFCSNVALVWTFNTRGVYNFIIKKANIPVNLVPFFNGVSFQFCPFLKSGVTNELKSLSLLKSKKIGQNFAVNKMLVWSPNVWRTATAIFF